MTIFNQVEYLDNYKQLGLPELDYINEGDACIDLRTVEDATILSDVITTVRTGIRIAIPESHVMLILPRSGLAAKHGITLANSVGVIDPNYRGEIRLALTCCNEASNTYIKAGERVAQFFVIPLERMINKETTSLNETERGVGSFGSTGRY